MSDLRATITRTEKNGLRHVNVWRKTDADSERFVDEFHIPKHFNLLANPYRAGMGQGPDGTAHLTYYDRERLFSYCWDGYADHIEVSHGGYGEPVVAHILIDPQVVKDLRDSVGAAEDEPYIGWHPVIFQHHINQESEVEEVACPECGAPPGSVEETATVENTVEEVVDGLIRVEHKEWFGHGDYAFVCSKNLRHRWPVTGEVEWI